MLDMKKIRQNVEVVQKKLKTRGVDEEVLLRFLALDEERRALLVKVE
ncbi:serine--tRNA ligase, partial [Enterococcus faecalis]